MFRMCKGLPCAVRTFIQDVMLRHRVVNPAVTS